MNKFEKYIDDGGFYYIFGTLLLIFIAAAIFVYVPPYEESKRASKVEIISTHSYDSSRILRDPIRGPITVVYFSERPTICYTQDGERGWLEIYNVDGWLLPRTDDDYPNFLSDPNCRTNP